MQVGEGDKFPYIGRVGAFRFLVFDIGEPFGFRRQLGQLLELCARQGVWGLMSGIFAGLRRIAILIAG